MAKDNPEDQTAPAYDTGETLRIFNPVTGEYETHNTADYEPRHWRPGGGNVIWGNVDGQTVLVRTDVEGWEDTGARQHTADSSQWTYGYVPPPSSPPPTTHGMGPDGGQIYEGGGNSGGTPSTTPPTNTPLDPTVNEPTDDWYWTDPLDYTNAPQPNGDGEFVEGGPPPDTSWDWNYFRDRAPGDRQWGGYDEDYQAFERYVPGMESPWGLPNVKGGNEDFYQQQFLNQLRDEQGFRNRQRAAQMRAAEAASEPVFNPLTDDPGNMWNWAYGGSGIPDVQMGTGRPVPASYSLANQFNRDSTLRDMISYYAGKEGFSQYADTMRNWLKNHTDEGLESTYWARIGDPNEIIKNLGGDLTVKNREWLTKMANAVYQPGEMGAYAPIDYASPIQWGGSYPGAAAQ